MKSSSYSSNSNHNSTTPAEMRNFKGTNHSDTTPRLMKTSERGYGSSNGQYKKQSKSLHLESIATKSSRVPFKVHVSSYCTRNDYNDKLKDHKKDNASPSSIARRIPGISISSSRSGKENKEKQSRKSIKFTDIVRPVSMKF